MEGSTLKSIQSSAIIALLTAGTLLADFQYQQTTTITGGMLQAMTRMAGTFSKQAREPIVSTIYVKGNRMARMGPHHGEVIDLDQENITTIDFDKKTYSVMTFQQMKEAMEEAVEKAKQQKSEGAENADVKFKATVKETKATKEISGQNTRDFIMMLTVEGSDRKSGEKASMSITSDLWMAPEIKGYQEYRNFEMRMAQKMGAAMGGSGMGAMVGSRPDMAKAFGEVAKETAKLKGVPVLTVTRIGTAADGGPLPAASEAPEAAQTKGPDMKGALAGAALGRFGGLGRKKDDTPKESADGKAAGPAILIETTTESSGYSSAAIEAARFEVPSGFKQVTPDSSRRKR